MVPKVPDYLHYQEDQRILEGQLVQEDQVVLPVPVLLEDHQYLVNQLGRLALMVPTARLVQLAQMDRPGRADPYFLQVLVDLVLLVEILAVLYHLENLQVQRVLAVRVVLKVLMDLTVQRVQQTPSHLVDQVVLGIQLVRVVLQDQVTQQDQLLLVLQALQYFPYHLAVLPVL